MTWMDKLLAVLLVIVVLGAAWIERDKEDEAP